MCNISVPPPPEVPHRKQVSVQSVTYEHEREKMASGRCEVTVLLRTYGAHNTEFTCIQ